MKLKNDLLLRTAAGQKVERPPVWLMRQAGRILPQYRAIRSQLSGFKELLKTPELAAEVTIQPIDELDVDAAIIFSDILVIPEAMGLDYEMVEKRGPLFREIITSKTDVFKLSEGNRAADTIDYVFNALEITKKELDGRVPLIGFSGAPWTLFAYMVEGSGSKTFSKARKMLYQEPELSHLLLEKITRTIIAYLKLKIRHGIDLIQIFDSWAGILPPDQYKVFALPYIAQICSAIKKVPITVFSKGAWFAWKELADLDNQVLGLDWTIKPQEARMLLGEDKVLQGNLDPCLLYASPESIQKHTKEMMVDFGENYIVNLGHGVYPDTPLENVKVFVNTAKNHRY